MTTRIKQLNAIARRRPLTAAERSELRILKADLRRAEADARSELATFRRWARQAGAMLMQ